MWMAKQKCPDIIFVPPQCELYIKHAQYAREIYSDYTDKVESYGLDECWLDLTESTGLFGSGKQVANEIRERMKKELGVSVSIGVSFNKVFAKLGSDLKKPDATTEIDKEHFKEIVWGLPAKELLFVGRSTYYNLKGRGILTIGDLAQREPDYLKSVFGKAGLVLWTFANGLDNTPVANTGMEAIIKSIGNSTTTPRNLTTDVDVRLTLMVLCESVSSRLREHDFTCRTVQLGIRDNNLSWLERQGKLEVPNRTAKSLFELSYSLYKKHWDGKPIRSLSVRACDLMTTGFIQFSLFSDVMQLLRQEALESAMDSIRNRFGHYSLQRGVMLTDTSLTSLDPKNEHGFNIN